MEATEFEKKLREFMDRELQGMQYQAVVVYTDGHKTSKGEMKIVNQTVGFDTNKVSFATAHAIFRSLELTVATMMKGIYGSQIKNDDSKLAEYDSMHL
ncbi:hypothetical protein HY990_02625 [Candidatus Micrarchaeota archaeon]|nr:hypothetical protein [Candidatus Micrarchaeota archaeon]